MAEKYKNTEMENAQITHTYLGYSHGVFTFSVTVELGVGSIAFGNIAIGRHYKGEVTGTKLGCSSIMMVLDTVGVDSWEELKGKYIRVNKVGISEPVSVIGHITKDKWMDVSDLRVNFKEEQQ